MRWLAGAWWSIWFQSAPGREAGRDGCDSTRVPNSTGFNPRPAVRPGETPDQMGSY